MKTKPPSKPFHKVVVKGQGEDWYYDYEPKAILKLVSKIIALFTGGKHD